jgi:hypothetical protein
MARDLLLPQHLARNWRNDPAGIARLLVRLAKHPPHFNYNPLYGAVRDLLVLAVPYDQVIEGIRRTRRESVRTNLVGVLSLIRDHFFDLWGPAADGRGPPRGWAGTGPGSARAV